MKEKKCQAMFWIIVSTELYLLLSNQNQELKTNLKNIYILAIY